MTEVLHDLMAVLKEERANTTITEPSSNEEFCEQRRQSGNLQMTQKNQETSNVYGSKRPPVVVEG
jgi:hypothetical protein